MLDSRRVWRYLVISRKDVEMTRKLIDESELTSFRAMLPLSEQFIITLAIELVNTDGVSGPSRIFFWHPPR